MDDVRVEKVDPKTTVYHYPVTCDNCHRVTNNPEEKELWFVLERMRESGMSAYLCSAKCLVDFAAALDGDVA